MTTDKNNLPAFQIPETYRLLRQAWISPLASELYELEHVATGARLILAQNDDPNKVFSIGFRTPPQNSTGIAHIVEHCVLSGSRKYHTKEPFMDLVQGSLQTFLNAMTYPDRTLYPVASRNDEDFHNLMDVYLDAVFFPAMLRDKRIFQQEGWHYEPSDDGEGLKVSGVVYNEMRGAMSNPMSVLNEELWACLFPDTCYQYNSGGDPDHIYELSYEEFCAFHERYYHPSNALIYLYGDCDMTEQLRYIDEDYLSQFSRQEVPSALVAQDPAPEQIEAQADYALPVDASPSGKSYAALAFMYKEALSLKERFRLMALFDVLVDNSNSPFRERVMDENLGEDVFSLSFDYLQDAMGVGVKNTQEGSLERVRTIFREVIEEAAQGGLEVEGLQASLNRTELDLRECYGVPTRGLIYALQVHSSGNYERDIFAELDYEAPLAELRSELEAGDLSCFEAALRRFLDEEGSIAMELEPRPGLNEAKDQALKESLIAKYQSLSPEARRAIEEEYEALRHWQETPDSPEARATIPRLDPRSMQQRILDFPFHRQALGEAELTTIETSTSDMIYLEMAFDVQDFTLDELWALNLWAHLLGDVATETMDRRTLEHAIFLRSGGFDFAVQAVPRADGSFGIFLRGSLKALGSQWDSALGLLTEVLATSCFDEQARIRELLTRQRIMLEQNFAMRGDASAALRVEAYRSAFGRVSDELAGFGNYQRLCELLDHWEERAPELLASLPQLAERALRRNALALSLTHDHPQAQIPALGTFVAKLPVGEVSTPQTHEPLGVLNEGIIVSSKVQYVASQFFLNRLEVPLNGSEEVVRHFVSVSYLHNQVRAIGGAYGVQLSMTKRGSVIATSFRDPNLQATLEAYWKIGQHLAGLELDQDSVDTAIIGSLSAFDPPMTPQAKGLAIFLLGLRGEDVEDVRRLYREALATTPQDFARYARIFQENFDAASPRCVVGGQDAILEAQDLLGRVVQLNEHGLHPLENAIAADDEA